MDFVGFWMAVLFVVGLPFLVYLISRWSVKYGSIEEAPAAQPQPQPDDTSSQQPAMTIPHGLKSAADTKREYKVRKWDEVMVKKEKKSDSKSKSSSSYNSDSAKPYTSTSSPTVWDSDSSSSYGGGYDSGCGGGDSGGGGCGGGGD